MLNNTGVVKETYGNKNQILFATEHQVSVGVVVDDSVVTASNGKKIVKAGTPLKGNLEARKTSFVAATASTTNTPVGVTGILLHDVDVTLGDNNGTLLIFGFVDLNKIDSTTAAKLTTEIKDALPMIQFIK